ncbi:M20 family metallo-hydrolase [Reichenbachiella versicolor]|uniref:M20 family metallo-hydrolase n=1 Tax=Reichenbachiella versicolor TaxID=1821036 RepID=UPI000D6E6149|nr:M20 family metallo-hydrolase [Reichenbachiella versicolor]
MFELGEKYSPKTEEAVNLLAAMIGLESFSRNEGLVADYIKEFLFSKGVQVRRRNNNLWATSTHWDDEKPTILLNSHHDTVRPSKSYTLDPFEAQIIDGRLYGLGSNDAGGPLVSLIQAFLHFYDQDDLPYNLVLAATAEEEISGENGIASILEEIGDIDLGIIGEPTLMDMAIAEKGLVVIDCEAKGKSGHAARNEGVNAIYKAMTDIGKLKDFKFEKVSNHLGPINVTVTQVEAGRQHNVVPDSCKFVIDVRTTDAYSNKETVDIISSLIESEVEPRSLRLNSSGISEDHPVVKRGEAIGMRKYGSPTLSDQALLDFTTIKIGPGDSARSHTADEYIYVDEIENGINLYIKLLNHLDISPAVKL